MNSIHVREFNTRILGEREGGREFNTREGTREGRSRDQGQSKGSKTNINVDCDVESGHFGRLCHQHIL